MESINFRDKSGRILSPGEQLAQQRTSFQGYDPTKVVNSNSRFDFLRSGTGNNGVAASGVNPAVTPNVNSVPASPNLNFVGNTNRSTTASNSSGITPMTTPNFDFGWETNYGYDTNAPTSGFNNNTTDAIYNGGVPENSGFDFGLTPDTGTGDSFLSGLDFGDLGTVATGAAGLFSAYNGLQGNRLAKKQFGFEKQAWQQNFDMQLDAYNTRKSDAERVQRSHGVDV